MRRKRLIVDGYNVIRSTSPYREIAETDMDSARMALLADLAGYSGSDRHSIIVFDGAANPHSEGQVHTVAGVDIIFSPFGKEADAVIERLVSQYRQAGDEVEVVTSDAQTQWAVMGESVTRRSAAEFTAEMGDARADWAEQLPVGRTSSPIEERIDPGVREVLEKWARGEE